MGGCLWSFICGHLYDLLAKQWEAQNGRVRLFGGTGSGNKKQGMQSSHASIPKTGSAEVSGGKIGCKTGFLGLEGPSGRDWTQTAVNAASQPQREECLPEQGPDVAGPSGLRLGCHKGTTWSVGRGPRGGATYSSSLSSRSRMFFLFLGQL